MGDFSKAFCPVHGRLFKEISVCGIMIPCCQDCTRPKMPMKNKKKIWPKSVSKVEHDRVTRNFFEAKREIAKNFSDYEVYEKGIHTHPRSHKKGSHRKTRLRLTHKKMAHHNILKQIKK